MSPKIAFITVFNHRFDQNISKLESIYQSRFSDIFHLVPFYDGDKENVIPVFESSFYFQGYFSPAYCKLKNKGFDYFIFIGDDLILNPSINEKNIIELLKLDPHKGFFPWFWNSIPEMSFQFPNFMPSVNSFYLKDLLKHHAPDWEKLLPDKESAFKIFSKYGFDQQKISSKNLKGYSGKYDYHFFKSRLRDYFMLFLKKRSSIPFPLACGYSDFIIVPSLYMEEFTRICEVFRMMRLWVETAIPTAMILSIPEIITEENTDFRGTVYQPFEGRDVKTYEDRFLGKNFDLEYLNNSFNDKELYIHPIKLSTVKI